MGLARTAGPADGSWDVKGGSAVPIPIVVALAGGLGALARYGIEGLVSRHATGAFPWGTFVVNVSGSFAVAVAFTLLTDRYAVPPWTRSAVTIGFLGAYTTFSTLSLETYRLFEDGAHGMAVANALGSLAAGLAAIYAGIVVGRLV
jgi:CrcB protein